MSQVEVAMISRARFVMRKGARTCWQRGRERAASDDESIVPQEQDICADHVIKEHLQLNRKDKIMEWKQLKT